MLALLPQAIIDGVLLGGIYLTVAMGFSMAFGVLHIIDFAVGEWIMLGAFIGLTFTAWFHLDPLLSLPVIFAIFGIFTHSLDTVLSQGSWHLAWGPVLLTIPLIRLAGLLYALAVILGLNYLLKRTDFGLAVRAVAQNKEAAGLMGVDIKRTNGAVYGLYVGISAMTGVFIGAIVSLNAGMGPDLTLFAFFVVVLAGMGYLSGVPWAAFLLGLIQSFFLIYFNPSHVLLALFSILYLILLISPTGLFRKGV